MNKKDTRQIPREVRLGGQMPTVFGLQRREARPVAAGPFDPRVELTDKEKRTALELSKDKERWVIINDTPDSRYQNANASVRYAAFFIASLHGENPELSEMAITESIGRAKVRLALHDPYPSESSLYWEKTIEQLVFLRQLVVPQGIPDIFMPQDMTTKKMASLTDSDDPGVYYGFLLMLNPQYSLSTYAQWADRTETEVKEAATRDIGIKQDNMRRHHNVGLVNRYTADLFEYVRYAGLTRLVIGEKDWKERVVFTQEDWEIIKKGMQTMRDTLRSDEEILMYAFYASMIAAEKIDFPSNRQLAIVMHEAEPQVKNKEEGGIPTMLDFLYE